MWIPESALYEERSDGGGVEFSKFFRKGGGSEFSYKNGGEAKNGGCSKKVGIGITN